MDKGPCVVSASTTGLCTRLALQTSPKVSKFHLTNLLRPRYEVWLRFTILAREVASSLGQWLSDRDRSMQLRPTDPCSSSVGRNITIVITGIIFTLTTHIVGALEFECCSAGCPSHIFVHECFRLPWLSNDGIHGNVDKHCTGCASLPLRMSIFYGPHVMVSLICLIYHFL